MDLGAAAPRLTVNNLAPLRPRTASAATTTIDTTSPSTTPAVPVSTPRRHPRAKSVDIQLSRDNKFMTQENENENVVDDVVPASTPMSPPLTPPRRASSPSSSSSSSSSNQSPRSVYPDSDIEPGQSFLDMTWERSPSTSGSSRTVSDSTAHPVDDEPRAEKSRPITMMTTTTTTCGEALPTDKPGPQGRRSQGEETATIYHPFSQNRSNVEILSQVYLPDAEPFPDYAQELLSRFLDYVNQDLTLELYTPPDPPLTEELQFNRSPSRESDSGSSLFHHEDDTQHQQRQQQPRSSRLEEEKQPNPHTRYFSSFLSLFSHKKSLFSKSVASFKRPVFRRKPAV